ncbi:hypothetical protein NC651_025123 [Populus alba x Populus x berolinensis]|nr:hypothetical protein NC651_025123 [Populus alba x Populus x berolinensis]
MNYQVRSDNLANETCLEIATTGRVLQQKSEHKTLPYYCVQKHRNPPILNLNPETYE